MIDGQLIVNLHTARLAHDAAKKAADEAMDKFRADNPEIFGNLPLLAENKTVCETALRLAIGETYKATKEKQFDYGCGVRVSLSPIYDADKALEWAKVNARVYVFPESLDSKGFEKWCKDADEKARPDFVTMADAVTPTIPTDLSKHIKEAI